MPQTKPRVLLDVDGVCADFVGHTLDCLAAAGGTRLEAADWDTWNIMENPRLTTLDKNKIQTFWNKEGFCIGIKPYDGAIEAITELQLLADVRFVTSPMWSRTWMIERTNWLHEHFGATPHEIVHTSDKEFVWGNCLVDDKPETVMAWHNRWCVNDLYKRGDRKWSSRHHKAFLWERPYNTKPETERIVYGNSWNEIIKFTRYMVTRYEYDWEMHDQPITWS